MKHQQQYLGYLYILYSENTKYNFILYDESYYTHDTWQWHHTEDSLHSTVMIIKKLSQSWQQHTCGDADKRQSTNANELLRSWQPVLRGGESTVYRRPGAIVRKDFITEKAPTRAFSSLKRLTSAFTLNNPVRHYAEWE